MVEQARARNAAAVQSGRVDLRYGSVESLLFDNNSFDKALAIKRGPHWDDRVYFSAEKAVGNDAAFPGVVGA